MGVACPIAPPGSRCNAPCAARLVMPFPPTVTPDPGGVLTSASDFDLGECIPVAEAPSVAAVLRVGANDGFMELPHDLWAPGGGATMTDRPPWSTTAHHVAAHELKATVRTVPERGRVRVEVGHDLSVVDTLGTATDVPRSELAVLVVLALSSTPLRRRDLAAACAISEQTLRPVLSRLPARLGLDGSLHRVARPRSGSIVAEKDRVDIGEAPNVRLEPEVSIARRACSDLGIVALHPLGAATIDALARHLADRRAALSKSTRSPAPGGTDIGAEAHDEAASAARVERALRLAAAADADSDPLRRQALAVAGVACSDTSTIDLRLAAALWSEVHTHEHQPLSELLASVPDVVVAGTLADIALVHACRSLVAPSELAWLHRRAFELLDQPDAEVADPTSRIELLVRRAHHARQADDHSLSVDVRADLRRAAGAAADRADTGAELRLLDAALETGPGSAERIWLLLTRGDAMRRHGPWRSAVDDYRRADHLARQLGDPVLRAEVGLHLARVTWEADLGSETDALLRSIRPALETADVALAARVDLCLAGGTYQDGLAGTGRVGRDTIERALAQVPTMIDPSARAWAHIHGRKALLGAIPATESLAMAEHIVADAGNDVATMAHGHQARLVDLWRLDRRAEAAAALRALRRLPIVSSEQAFSLESAIACLDLALGRYDGAFHAVEQEQTYRDRLAGDTFDQVTLAHLVWLAIVRRDPLELAPLAEAARSTRDAAGRRPTIWVVGSALIDLASGDLTSAASAIDELAGDRSLASLADGPHRLPSMAITAQVAAACRHHEPLHGRHVETALDALGAGSDEGVLIGWPTLFLGPTDRFRACAALAAGDLQRARDAIGRALHADRLWPAQLAASLRVLAEIEADAGRGDVSSKARGRAEAIERALRRRLP